MKLMRLLSSLARIQAVDLDFGAARACSGVCVASHCSHQVQLPIQSGPLPSGLHIAPKLHRHRAHPSFAQVFCQSGRSVMTGATKDTVQRDACNDDASVHLSAQPLTLTSKFLLRHDAGSTPPDTVVVVLNWQLPACTPRLLSAGG